MRACLVRSCTAVLALACADGPAAKGADPDLVGGDDTAAAGDTAADTGAAVAPAPAWLQVGNQRVRATHFALVAEAGAAASAGSLALETRGWGSVGVGGEVGWGEASEPLLDMPVALSVPVDPQALVDGVVVPPEVCEDTVVTWTLDLGQGAADRALVALAPAGEERCVVDGTQRPALLGVELGTAAWVSFSSENLSAALPGATGCTLTAFDGEEETLSRDVDCATSVRLEDGEADVSPGAVRLELADGGAVLVVGIVAGSAGAVAAR